MKRIESYRVLRGFRRLGGTFALGLISGRNDGAIAWDRDQVWVALLRREGESRRELMNRLERELARCLMCNRQVDELHARAEAA